MTKKIKPARKPRPSELLATKPRTNMLPKNPDVAKMGKPPTDAKPGPGRPKTGYDKRYTLRVIEAQPLAWKLAAKAAKLKLQDWCRNTLDYASGRVK